MCRLGSTRSEKSLEAAPSPILPHNPVLHPTPPPILPGAFGGGNIFLIRSDMGCTGHLRLLIWDPLIMTGNFKKMDLHIQQSAALINDAAEAIKRPP